MTDPAPKFTGDGMDNFISEFVANAEMVRRTIARARDPAEAVAAYRQAALTSPTFTGTASAPDLCQCQDGTGTCKYRRIDGGLLWSCMACRREWIASDPAHVEDPEAGYWASLLVILAVFGSGIVLGLGVLIGYVWRGWAA